MTFEDFKTEWMGESEFIQAHTSGSTGTPKAILLSKSDMSISARATNEYFGVNLDSVLAIPLSCDYIAGKMMAVRAYEAGCRLLVISPSNDFEIGEDKIDIISVVPSQVDCLLRNQEWASRIGAVLIGGAPLSPAKGEALIKAGYKAYVSYGMTETCSHVALARIGGPYVSMPGVSFSADNRGCLVVKVPKMSIREVVTNDVVELIDEHTFKWLGRYDNVINSGGIKIFPEILEKEISKFVDADFYIVGIPDDKWGQAVQMVVEGDEMMREGIENMLKVHLNHKFLPKNIRFIRILERTSNGKLKRLAYSQ